MSAQAFTFFIAGGTELANRALANFERLIRPRVSGDCRLIVIDILKEPRKAREHRVIATPMLVRNDPAPIVKILGDLSQDAVILAQLGLSSTDGSARP
jgi:circadian clock protein KaiB